MNWRHVSDSERRVYEKQGDVTIQTVVLYVLMWGGISLVARMELYTLSRGTMAAHRYRNDILDHNVRSCAYTEGEKFILQD